MSKSIFVPAASIQMFKAVNVVIPYKGYDISIDMDSSHNPVGDLTRSTMLVFAPDGQDITKTLQPNCDPSGMSATGDYLKQVMMAIDLMTAETETPVSTQVLETLEKPVVIKGFRWEKHKYWLYWAMILIVYFTLLAMWVDAFVP